MLIKARDEFRRAFGQSPPSAECRQFDREQAQKLRKPHDIDERSELLAGKHYPFLTILGRKGGTTAAVAAVNALLRLA